MEEKLSITNFYKHPRFRRHFVLWLVVYLFFFVVVGILHTNDELSRDDLEFPFFMLLIKVLIYGSFTVYNRFFPQKRYFLVGSVIFLIILFVSWLLAYTDTFGVNIGALKGFWANVIVLPMILFVAFGFKLAYHGARQLIEIQTLKTKQLESELKLLRSQVNPHFLFNTLNNIYSTNLDDQNKANEMILGLADLLRYQLESGKEKYCLLEREIEGLENYISLEKIRVRECEITLQKEGDFKHTEIAPLILLPFVENAMKYGTGIQKGKIEVKFKLINGNEFEFQCKNRIVQKNGKVHSGGIGLENVKKRLQLLYPNQHTLEINEAENNYLVNLKIKL